MEQSLFNEDERHYIGLLQDSINRMANNSANCKNWLFVVVAALIAFVADNKESSNILWALLIVDLLFYFFDAYYLTLENNFRDLENNFVKLVKSANKDKDEQQEINPNVIDIIYNFNFRNLRDNTEADVNKKNRKKALCSPSTWPFYLTIAIVIVVVIGILQDWHPCQIICNCICNCNK